MKSHILPAGHSVLEALLGTAKNLTKVFVKTNEMHFHLVGLAQDCDLATQATFDTRGRLGRHQLTCGYSYLTRRPYRCPY